MKKSFHLHLFIRIFIATAVIIYSNRILSQYLTTRYLHERIEQNIAHTLDTCQNEATNSKVFSLCASRSNRGEALSSVSEYYVLCEPQDGQSLPEEDIPCNRSKHADASQYTELKAVSEAVQMGRMNIDGDEWMAFSLSRAPDKARVMIRPADVTHYVNSIWNLRDRILIYVLPVVITMLTMLTAFMIWSVMRPIRQLEKSLTGLSSSNLDKPLDVLPPYREFSSFVAVFEQLRERLNESFLQTRRFAADASHELRTPLTILRGNSERLIAELPTGSDAQLRMRLIGDEIERLIEITEKLLMLSRADASSIRHDMQPISLSDLITELANDAVAFHPTLRIHTQIDTGLHWRCDQSLIQQLLYNLYTNAAKYNVNEGWIKFSLVRQPDRFVLKVENPCDNIPVDLTERAFQRFYRGDAARGRAVDGIGLGLSLCLEIAKLHDAKLSLQVTQQNTVIATLEGNLDAPGT